MSIARQAESSTTPVTGPAKMANDSLCLEDVEVTGDEGGQKLSLGSSFGRQVKSRS